MKKRRSSPLSYVVASSSFLQGAITGEIQQEGPSLNKTPMLCPCNEQKGTAGGFCKGLEPNGVSMLALRTA